MLSQHFAFCPECHGDYYLEPDENNILRKKKRKPMMYTDIAADHGLSSANTAKRICVNGLEKIRNIIKQFH